MKNKKIQLGLSIGVPLLALIFPILGFSGALSQKNNDTTYANWMSNVADSTSLRDVQMPGSHDTMALYSIANLAGQCQSLSLQDQLDLGVRFLDIRLKEENNALKAVHGFIDQRASFLAITNIVEKFIQKHQSEFIIMSIKEEADQENSTLPFEECLKLYLTNDIYLLDTHEVPSTLGDVRGKVLLLSRYANSTIGIPAYDGWMDSCSFTLPNDIYVQDTYQITSAKQKEEEIVTCFNETGHNLKINFLSACRTDSFPPSYSVSAAKDINPWINKNIKNFNDRNIVLYDFISKANMNAFFEGIL